MSGLLSVLLAALLVLAPSSRALAATAAVPVDGPVLASGTSGLDGERVVLEGECVSEALYGGRDHVWVNVLSNGTAIGVWMPQELAAELGVVGTWKNTGDVVRVVGVFNEACDQHGGDLDVHAETLALLRPGERRDRPVSWWKLAVGLAGGVAAYVGWRRMRRVEEEIPA